MNGIEFATNLITLDIRQNAITDLSPITDLNKLQALFFWRNPIDDISPLANLTRMKNLDAGTCQITDISPLRQLTRLEKLNLSRNIHLRFEALTESHTHTRIGIA